ncbi:hypothetical protein RJ641_023466 [Dillenia turbinata]|uniref:DNA-directed RNA polymerase subunit n=1 Tax=Dillenia turbinata TaxID=194707 RepID=A0AAN8YVN1_9MAGN
MRDLGYILAVTALNRIEEGKVQQQTGEVAFPVVSTCLTFKIFKGEIPEGVVHRIWKHGVFLRCGPIHNLYLSNQKMPGYDYMPGETHTLKQDVENGEGRHNCFFMLSLQSG